jgi:alpha-beta hydrolase superfamily lysophospholipase
MIRLFTITIVALVAAACAKPYYAVRYDAPPYPDVGPGVLHMTEKFSGVGGVQLFGQGWRSGDSQPRGVVVIVHGLRDHGDRYSEFAVRLAKRGYAVYAADLRGHGRSSGRRVTIGSFDEYVDDLELWVSEVAAREHGLPIFVFGHSMGGAIATLFAERHPNELAGLITSAPAIRIDTIPLAAAGILLAATLTPNVGALAPNNDHFSSDPKVEADMGKDPLIYQPGGPVATARGLTGAISEVWAGTHELTMPMLLLHGTADHLTAPAGSRDLYERAPSTDKTLRLYDGLAHDLVHEPGDKVAPDVIAWLDAHTGGDKASFPAPDLSRALRGDGFAPAASVAIDGGYRRGGGDQWGGLAVRTRWLLGGPVAYSLAVDLSAFAGSAFAYRAIGYPIGVAVQHGGHTLSIGVGVGVSDPGPANAALELPIAIDAETQLGPVRLLAWGRASWIPGSEMRRLGTGANSGPDELHAGLAVRVGRNHRYWAHVNAGAGPYLGVTFEEQLGAKIVGVVLGIDLWGGTR